MAEQAGSLCACSALSPIPSFNPGPSEPPDDAVRGHGITARARSHARMLLMCVQPRTVLPFNYITIRVAMRFALEHIHDWKSVNLAHVRHRRDARTTR